MKNGFRIQAENLGNFFGKVEVNSHRQFIGERNSMTIDNSSRQISQDERRKDNEHKNSF